MLLGALLAPHLDVVYTRKSDIFIELSKRASMANDMDADAFLSIHCNSGSPGQGDGFEVFTAPGETGSDRLATCLFFSYGTRFTLKRKRADLSDGDEDKEARFTVLTRTAMPAALFELEFIHTIQGEAWLREPANQLACAEALAPGVLHYFGITTPIDSPIKPAVLTQKDRLLAKIDELKTIAEAL